MSTPCCSQKSGTPAIVLDLFLLGPRLMAKSLQAASELLEQTSELLAKSTPALKLPQLSACCEIPETECPPHCVCCMHLDVRPGETVTATVGVTNRSSSARMFVFAAAPFQTPGGPVPVWVAPETADLKPCESVLVTAKFTATDLLQPGYTYSTELLIRGAYEQCVCLTTKVLAEKLAHCEVEQAEPPVRIRAHQWYDHFQCEQPCLRPTQQTKGAPARD
jgi:hypothetical protein